jgi:hypothetical protein
MDFLNNLGTRTLNAIDNHPRIVAGSALVFSLLFHPALTVVAAVGFIAYAYIANEVKN